MSTTHDINDILEIQRKCYSDATSLLFTSLNERIENQNNLIQELKHSLEYSQAEIKDISNELKITKSDICDLRKKTEEQELIIKKLTVRNDDLENFSRRNNIRVDGIKEQTAENKEKLQVEVHKILKDKMKLEGVEIVNIHRLPRKDDILSRPRTIIARLSKEGDRDVTMKNTWRLKNSGIFITEDVCENTAKLRRDKLPLLKEARNNGKIAFFNRSKLIIKNRRSTK